MLSRCPERIGLYLALTAGAAFGQTPAVAPSFEVASIKPTADLMTLAQQVRDGKAHVGVRIDAHRVDIGASSLMDLVCLAYKAQRYQVSGPDWMIVQRFDIVATIPEGASKDQVPEMMQALLSERFKLTVHRENKDHPIYALVVGRNGSKLKESPESDTPAPAGSSAKGGMTIDTGNGPQNFRSDGKGGTTISGGPNGTTRIMPGDGVVHIESSRMTMTELVAQLTQFMDHPVFDMTGLKGNWQVAMDIPISALLNMQRAQGLPIPALPGANASGPAGAASDPSGIDEIFESVQKLGLKLDSRKAPLEYIVVDHLEKTPTEN